MTIRQGREWQCDTIQFDLVMPRSFQADYIARDGGKRPLVILHRALYGSLERFLGILLEHHGPFLPAWLAPVQARVLPVAERHAAWARALERSLQAQDPRCDTSPSDESLGRRVALARHDAVPFVLAVGDREIAGGPMAIRTGEGTMEVGAADAAAWLRERCADPFSGEEDRCVFP